MFWTMAAGRLLAGPEQVVPTCRSTCSGPAYVVRAGGGSHAAASPRCAHMPSQGGLARRREPARRPLRRLQPPPARCAHLWRVPTARSAAPPLASPPRLPRRARDAWHAGAPHAASPQPTRRGGALAAVRQCVWREGAARCCLRARTARSSQRRRREHGLTARVAPPCPQPATGVARGHRVNATCGRPALQLLNAERRRCFEHLSWLPGVECH